MQSYLAVDHLGVSFDRGGRTSEVLRDVASASTRVRSRP
jgi:hypothetical protein